MNPNDFINQVPDLREENAIKEKDSQVELKHIKDITGIKQLIKDVSSVISDAIDRKTITVKMDEFPKSILTPDVQGLIVEIKTLRDKLLAKETPEDKVSHDLLEKLLTSVQSLSTNKPTNYEEKIDEVIKAVNAIKMDFKPNISVKPSDVSVQSDFTLLEDKLDILTKAVKAISIVVPEQDDTAILKRISAVTKAINSLSFPVPNYILPFKASDGSSTQLETSVFSDINGIGIPAFDYCAQTQATLTDTWVFKSGGSGGTTVATVVITYTDAGKTIISTVARS